MSGAGAAPVAAKSEARRLTFPDALRGFAAFWVVLFHVGAAREAPMLRAALPAWIRAVVFDAGHFGVPVFFVLSGFVIALSIGTDRVDARYVGRFALRRAIRLDIPYWGAIAITIAFIALKKSVTGHSLVALPGVTSVLAHMFYLQVWLGIPDINPVFWTLTFEVQFYLLFCALLAVAHRRSPTGADDRRLVAPFGVAALVAIVWPMVPALDIPGLSLVQWHGFLLGAFAAWVVQRRLAPRWFAVFAVLLCGTWAVTRDSFTPVCLATASVLLLAGRADTLATGLAQRPLQFLGRLSYSLYLLHVPVSGAAFYVMNGLATGSVAADTLGLAVVLAANVAAAHLYWRAVERPSTALARRLRTRS